MMNIFPIVNSVKCVHFLHVLKGSTAHSIKESQNPSKKLPNAKLKKTILKLAGAYHYNN